MYKKIDLGNNVIVKKLKRKTEIYDYRRPKSIFS